LENDNVRLAFDTRFLDYNYTRQLFMRVKWSCEYGDVTVCGKKTGWRELSKAFEEAFKTVRSFKRDLEKRGQVFVAWNPNCKRRRLI
jgi:hypothetical protein